MSFLDEQAMFRAELRAGFVASRPSSFAVLKDVVEDYRYRFARLHSRYTMGRRELERDRRRRGR